MRPDHRGDYQYGKCFQPLYDKDYETARDEWLEGLRQWLDKTHEDYDPQEDYWEYDNPPDRKYYRPKWNADQQTCYQIYETVSEGTPVSPVFNDTEQMVKWLIAQGHTEHAARAFVSQGFVMSAVFANGKMAMGIDSFDL